ncbi:hypothetical protein P0D88_11630 [Paraburkholderia sp. RL18-103-BIB-C]|jgi:hypothetical protein|uniref:hypothetical protein n=1 Tax=unclassified Paraburkholderia TaxID=2615204 RepID=UPI002F7B0C11
MKSGINKSALNANGINRPNKNNPFDEGKMSGRFIKKKNYPKKIGGNFFIAGSARE